MTMLSCEQKACCLYCEQAEDLLMDAIAYPGMVPICKIVVAFEKDLALKAKRLGWISR